VRQDGAAEYAHAGIDQGRAGFGGFFLERRHPVPVQRHTAKPARIVNRVQQQPADRVRGIARRVGQQWRQRGVEPGITIQQ